MPDRGAGTAGGGTPADGEAVCGGAGANTRGLDGIGRAVELRRELEELRIEVRGAMVAAQTLRASTWLRRSRQRLEQGAEFIEKRVGY